MTRIALLACSALAAASLLHPAAAQPVIAAQPDPAGAIAPFARSPADDPPLSRDDLVAALRRRVKYVFVVFQENRSFDHYYGTFPGANGLFSDGTKPRAAADTPGFVQEMRDTDGKTVTVTPFRLGPAQHAADLDDVDHGHARMAAKMHLVDGVPRMDRFAAIEEQKYVPAGVGLPTLRAKQFGQLAMAYVDCDTVPLMWHYATRFTLFDNIFQTTVGPSTPNAIAMIAGQSGETQWVKRTLEGKLAPKLPVFADPIPFWGSRADATPAGPDRQPANEKRETYGTQPANIADNLTFSSLPLTLAGRTLPDALKTDRHPDSNLADVQQDIPAIVKADRPAFPWGWYEEGYDREPNEAGAATHESYIGHHNGAQYFGYVADNPAMSANLHGLGDFFTDMAAGKLPESGLFFIRGGYTDITGLKPAWNDGSAEANAVQQRFQGDDDHPAYSDSEISEALVARSINAIARSPYWGQSAIIVTYDESEGDYDHVPPRILSFDADGLPISRGPRIPLLLVSPYARAHAISHEEGDHNSVIKLVDTLFDLPPLAGLPDELQARIGGHDPRFNGPRRRDAGASGPARRPDARHRRPGERLRPRPPDRRRPAAAGGLRRRPGRRGADAATLRRGGVARHSGWSRRTRRRGSRR